jgi:hypothetical protein
MPSLYQPRRGGSIKVLSEKAASEILVDLTKRPDSSEFVDREEEFINEYIQQNTKRIQVEPSSPILMLFSFYEINNLECIIKHNKWFIIIIE